MRAPVFSEGCLSRAAAESGKHLWWTANLFAFKVSTRREGFPMGEPLQDGFYDEIRLELQALRNKLDQLETRQATFRDTPRFNVHRRYPKLLIVAAVSLATLLWGSGLLWSDEIKALFIDNAGNVHIKNLLIGATPGSTPFKVVGTSDQNWLTVLNDGQVKMDGGNVGIEKDLRVGGDVKMNGSNVNVEKALTVGGNAVINKALVGNIGFGTDIPGFASSDSANYKGYALAQSRDGKSTYINKAAGPGAIRFRVNNEDKMVIADDGRIGINQADPQAALDVIGVIRGTPWMSNMYEVSKGGTGTTQMTRVDRSVCFLTMVSGYFNGGTQKIWIEQGQERWLLKTNDIHDDGVAQARCIGRP